MSTPLIYNPASGGGRGQARLEKTVALFEKKGAKVAPMPTEGPGHAGIIADELCRDGHDQIYILGGDGTLSEACNGILGNGHKPTLGMIPGGTGNSFLDEFGLHELQHGVKRALTGKPRSIDAGSLRFDLDGEVIDKHWINIIGTGFAPLAAEAANRHYKWAKDRAYDLGVIHRLIKLRHIPWKLRLDGENHDDKYSLVMVCNSIHTGKGMKMAPDAKPDDGLLDVVVAKPMSRLALLGMLTKVQSGKHIEHPAVEVFKAKKIHIEPEQPSPLLVDGEVFGKTPLELEVKPGALSVLLS